MSKIHSVASKLTDYNDPTSFGSRLRAKRVKPLTEMIEAVFAMKGSVEIIDLGGTERYWSIIPSSFLESRKVKITLVNNQEIASVTMNERFLAIRGDACDLQMFRDNHFDIAHSNSVIEHVGDWHRMRSFASEMQRVAAKYFCQTPNFWFPIEPHCMTPFFHWLPRPTRIWLVGNFRLGHWKKGASVDECVRMVESARLLSKKMMHELFPHARIVVERFLGLPKSIVVFRH